MPGENLLGNCNTCCTCSSPSLAYVTRSASKSKCGIFDPITNKWFSQRTITTQLNINDSLSSNTPLIPPAIGEIVSSCNESFSAISTETTTYNPSGCSSFCSAKGNGNGSFVTMTRTTETFPGFAIAEADQNESFVYTQTGCGVWLRAFTASTYHYNQSSPTTPGGSSSTGPATIFDSTSPPFGATAGTCDGSSLSSPTLSTGYNNEYTTSQLKSNTIATLPTWGSFNTGSASCLELASYELTASGASFSVEQGQYQFLFLVPPTMKYQIKWSVVFVPDSGNPSIISTQQFNWNGPTPMGYNPTGESTWPSTPVYMVNQPSSNGVVKLSGISYVCGPNFSGVVC